MRKIPQKNISNDFLLCVCRPSLVNNIYSHLLEENRIPQKYNWFEIFTLVEIERAKNLGKTTEQQVPKSVSLVDFFSFENHKLSNIFLINFRGRKKKRKEYSYRNWSYNRSINVFGTVIYRTIKLFAVIKKN